MKSNKNFIVFRILQLHSFIFLSLTVNSQNLFEKYYGGSNHDSGTSIEICANGDLLLGGSTKSYFNDNNNYYLIRINLSGDTLWSAIYGHPDTTYNESLTDLIEMPDGDIVMVGYFRPGWLVYDYIGCILIRVDSTGNVKWSKQVEWADAKSVRRTNDNKLIIGGYSLVPFAVPIASTSLIDSSGSIAWGSHIHNGGPNNAHNNISIFHSNGTIYSAGLIESFGSYALLTRYDTTGVILWTRKLSGFCATSITDLTELTDGSMIAIGNINGCIGTNNRLLLMRINENGGIIWSKSIAPENGSSIYPKKITIDTSGKLIVGGFFTNGLLGGNDIFLLKSDISGNIIKTSAFGNSSHNYISDMLISANNDLYILSDKTNVLTMGDFWLIKSDSSLSTACGNYLLNLNEITESDFFIPYSPTVYFVTDTLPDYSFIVGFGAESSSTCDCSVQDIVAQISDSIICEGDSVTLNATGGTIFFWSDSLANGSIIQPIQSGILFVTGLDAGNCIETDSIQLIVNAVPIVEIDVPLIDTFCSTAGSVLLPNASPAGGIFTGTGVSGNTFSPQISGTGNFPAYYTFTDTNLCFSTDSINFVVELCTDVIDELQDTFHIFYSNNTNELSIETGLIHENPAKLLLFNNLGQIIFCTDLYLTGNNRIRLNNFSGGIYFYYLSTESAVINGKILIN